MTSEERKTLSEIVEESENKLDFRDIFDVIGFTVKDEREYNNLLDACKQVFDLTKRESEKRYRNSLRKQVETIESGAGRGEEK